MEYLESELAETQLALQQVVELSSNEARGYTNPTVWITSRLGLKIGNASSVYVKGRNFPIPMLSRNPTNTSKKMIQS
jgi:hypothetical protein